MQTLARSGLTASQVTTLIRDAPAVQFAAGMELLDIGLNVLEDITGDFHDGVVARDGYATLHGTGTFHLTRELNWGTAIVRPYMTLTAGTLSARFNLGAYLTSSPRTEAEEDPITHEVIGFDLLHWLNTPTGEAYTVGKGKGYLQAVEDILNTQGIQDYLIDQDRAATTLPVARNWLLDTQTTWLGVINDLLLAIGYMGLWSDWDGVLRATPYINPRDRAAEWLYTADPTQSMIGTKRAAIRDYFAAPNRWVFFWNKTDVAPVEGNGKYTYQNDSIGPTSVQARGRVITAVPQQIDVADQAALVAAAQQRIDADLRLSTTFELPTFPNPLHWHFDRLLVHDPGIGPWMDVLSTKWSLPLDGGEMTHSWSLLS